MEMDVSMGVLSTFMSQNRIRATGQHSISTRNIRVAYADGMDLDKDLIWSCLVEIDPL